jgi:lipopolysaccharide transport system ATP-binding protein
LSRVTSPTTGIIKAKGRIASLLEVGTGFHPELTGRENIYMNGSIMGMTKKEIDGKLDEIVEFAGVARYLDTPAKRYSSGMTVRLGFAIAAHLDPEILVVDEVLAVGDAEFQKKAIGKMQDVSKGEGRTVLFVSHNMGAVKNLCKTGLVLKNGQIAYMGDTNNAITYYLGNGNDAVAGNVYESSEEKKTDIKKIEVLDSVDNSKSAFAFNEKICMKFYIDIERMYLNNLVLGVRVRDHLERNVFTTNVQLNTMIKKEGSYILKVSIPPSILVPNKYSIHTALHIPNQKFIVSLDSPVTFSIEETGTDFFQYAGTDYGCVNINCDWEFA